MLATECARNLGYRDSYLLFNKNRSLYKIIATQAEKDDLINQGILPYSYRSRQIAIVTAKSMFRQFGSRIIEGGRRVRDDYWEGKAKKQGFTEEDMAGEKRPGAQKARDAAAAEANASIPVLGHGDVIYSNGPPLESLHQAHGLPPGMGGINPTTLAPLPMINLAPTDPSRTRDFANISRPRQEMTGVPYQDRTQPSGPSEILNQASHTADFNKILNQQSAHRRNYLKDTWNKEHEPVQTAQPHHADTGANQAVQSPHMTSPSGPSNQPPQQQTPQQQTSHNPHQPPPPMMSSQSYSQQSHNQNIMAQSPIRSSMPSQGLRPDQLHHRPSSLSLSSAPSAPSPYGYQPSPSQMGWGQPPPQPQQSPLSSHHSMPGYAPSTSPHPSQSPHHHQPPPPQMHHQQSSGGMHPGGMGYMGMQGQQYPGMQGRNMYQTTQAPQGYMPQASGSSQPGMQGWAPPPQGGQQWSGGY